MLRAEPALRACAREGWGALVSLGLSVSPGGEVRHAEVQGALSGSATGRCLEAELRKLRFPPTSAAADKTFFWSLQLPDAAAAPGQPRGRRIGS